MTREASDEQHLARLSDHLLRDIGLQRSEIAYADKARRERF